MNQFLTNFTEHRNVKFVAQEQSIEWLKKYHGPEFEAIVDKFSVSKESIGSRACYAPSIGEFDLSKEDFFHFDQSDEQIPDLKLRAILAQEKIEEIFDDLFEDEKSAPDHLIHVSCTHYQSPSAAQKLISIKSWGTQTVVTHLYHMGCYAAFPALRTSAGFNALGADKIDIVHTELCSFHLNKKEVNPGSFIMKTLFADGAIRYQSLSEEEFKMSGKPGLQTLALLEQIFPNTEDNMHWKLTEDAFSMYLSKDVPKYLATGIRGYLATLANKAGLDLGDLLKNAIFAIHPGGPKIVDLIQNELDLSGEQVEDSKYILNTRGNMSSATIAHIWGNIIKNKADSKKYVVSVAFGPGLTLTGAISRLC